VAVAIAVAADQYRRKQRTADPHPVDKASDGTESAATTADDTIAAWDSGVMNHAA
jgi:hypothetical protein